MPNTTKLQLTHVKFNYITSSKQVTIVNRADVSKRKIASTNGHIDVRTLNITAVGGVNYPDFASFFNSGTTGNAFRLSGFRFDVLSNNVSAIDNLHTSDSDIRAVVFPNLVKSNFTIKYNNANTSNVKIQIFDTTGISVYSKQSNNISTKDIEVNFEKMKSGIYFCNIIDNEGIITKKIIKQ